jgi:hypothetical protein
MKNILFIILSVIGMNSLSFATSNPVIRVVENVSPKSSTAQVISSPEQVKCKIVVRRCGGFVEWVTYLSSEQDCAKAQNIANYVSHIYNSIACD